LGIFAGLKLSCSKSLPSAIPEPLGAIKLLIIISPRAVTH